MDGRIFTDEEMAALVGQLQGDPRFERALQRASETRLLAESRLVMRQAGLNPDNQVEVDAFLKAYDHEAREEAEPNALFAARRAAYQIRQARALEAENPVELLNAGYDRRPRREDRESQLPKSGGLPKSDGQPLNDAARAMRSFDDAYALGEEQRTARKILDQYADQVEDAAIFGGE